MELKFILLIFACMIFFCYVAYKPNIEFFYNSHPRCRSTEISQKHKNKDLSNSMGKLTKMKQMTECDAKKNINSAKGHAQEGYDDTKRHKVEESMKRKKDDINSDQKRQTRTRNIVKKSFRNK